MATSPSNPHFALRPHPKKRRLLILILFALAGLGFLYVGHSFCKISRRLNHLSSIYYSKNLEQIALLRSVESVERQLTFTKRDNEHLSQQLSQHQTELSKVSRQVQELYTTMTKHSQEITKIKKELETTENVIQAMMTSQVADIKRHDDLWKAIKNIEESVENHVDEDAAQVVFKTLFTKLDEITNELIQQKAKASDLVKTKEIRYEKMLESINTLEVEVKNKVDVESTMAIMEAYDNKLKDMAHELNFQKTKTEEFSKSRVQQATEMWRAIDTLRSDMKKCQRAEDAASLYVDFYKKLENMEKELAQQKAKLEDLDQPHDIKLHKFEEIWRAINRLRDSVRDFDHVNAFAWRINAKIEDLSQQLKSQNVNMEEQQPEENINKASEEVLFEENMSQDKVFEQEEESVNDYDTSYRQNYNRMGYRKNRYSGRREKETKNETHESKEQKTWNDLMKGFNQFRKKVQGEIEKVAEKVSDQVKKVKEEVENYFE